VKNCFCISKDSHMKIPASRFCRSFVFFFALFILAALSFAVSSANAAVALEAKGAELCYKCHPELKQKFTQAAVHTPVKMGLCESCHNPHTAKYPKLLRFQGADLCYSCHAKQKSEFSGKVSVHRPIKDGKCTACHDPHAAPQKFQLAKSGGELCLTCHSALKDKPKKFTHAPFQTGNCVICHQPHASSEPALLKASTSRICTSCHNLAAPQIKRAHGPFSMDKVACEQCHNPHGSDNKGLIKSIAHQPFAQGRCGNCHQVTGPDPKKTNLAGKDLCLTCHAKIAQTLKEKGLHPPVAAGQCTACHTPHASEAKGLIKAKERNVCLACHTKIEERFRASKAFHPEDAAEGRCTACHKPHNSDQPTLLAGEPLKLCGTCHSTHASLSHPMGAGITDPRSNSPVTCLSCHDPHGTTVEKFLRGNPKRDLCIECHKQYR
jgi:predicted CXXCH cytochrome family protein